MTRTRGAIVAGDTYRWVGPSGATWDTRGAWFDVTTGVISRMAPRQGDSVVLSSATITGAGAARVLTTSGATSLLGDYTVGTLDGSGSLYLGSAASPISTIHAQTMRISGQSAGQIAFVYVSNETLDVAHTLTWDAITSVTGSVVRAGRLVLGNTGSAGPTTLSIDANSSVEVGGTGAGRAGALTVDAGATMTATGSIRTGGAGYGIYDNGVIVAKGALDLDFVTGSGTVDIAAHSRLNAASIGSVTIAFATGGGELSLSFFEAGYPISPQAHIEGFGVGDIIDLAAPVESVHVRAVAGGEQLVIQDFGGGVETVDLPDSHAGVLLLNGTEIVGVPASTAGQAAPGTQTGEVFRWTGNAGADWGLAGSWYDITRHGVASVAPGAQDTVVIGPVGATAVVLTGVGAARQATVAGPVIVDGQFSFGRLLDAGSLTLAGASCQLTVAGAFTASPGLAGIVTVTQGAILNAGTISGGSWSVDARGVVLAGTLRLGGSIVVGTRGRFEVGTANTGRAGTFTVDVGAVAAGTVLLTGNAEVDGRLVLTSGTSTVTGTLGGTGQVVLNAGAELFVQQQLSAPTIDFVGAGATLAVDIRQSVVDRATLVGLGSTDLIGFGSPSPASGVISGRLTANGHNGASLTVSEPSGTVIAQLTLIGDYFGASLLDVSQSVYGLTAFVLPRIDPSVKPGQGTGTARALTWNPADKGGAWGDAANWLQGSPGQVPAAAPGHLDSVTIGTLSSLSPPIVVTGAGEAASLTVNSSVVFNGIFSVGSADVLGGAIVGGTGSILTAATLAGQVTVDAGQLVVPSCTLEQSNSAVRDGGLLAATTLEMDGALTIDATSAVVVGASRSFTNAGALTVEAGATATVNGDVFAPVVDNGVLADGYAMTLRSSVSGSGQITIGSSGPSNFAEIDGSVSAGVTIALLGGGATFISKDPTNMHGTVAGFTTGDIIELLGSINASSVHYQATGPSGGQLVLDDSVGHALADIQLAGDYRGASFSLFSSPGYEASIQITGFRA